MCCATPVAPRCDANEFKMFTQRAGRCILRMLEERTTATSTPQRNRVGKFHETTTPWRIRDSGGRVGDGVRCADGGGAHRCRRSSCEIHDTHDTDARVRLFYTWRPSTHTRVQTRTRRHVKRLHRRRDTHGKRAGRHDTRHTGTQRQRNSSVRDAFYRFIWNGTTSLSRAEVSEGGNYARVW